jgi:hypothetical protein
MNPDLTSVLEVQINPKNPLRTIFSSYFMIGLTGLGLAAVASSTIFPLR